jgi:cell wall-associated NlpC family hydrolase
MMRCYAFGAFVLFVALMGCASYPRYRTGGVEQPMETTQADTTLTTNDYIRLGLILQDYLGKPYRGRSIFVRGVDCSLFAREVFEQFDEIELPRTVHEQYKMGREISYSHLAFGDLVFFRTERGKVSHVGIYVGDNRFIHASTSQGVIISSINEKYWAQRYAGGRRILP